ncbi:TauD/TfdA family dioxygenase [Thiomonas bhubaneswarensis]|uniref:Taurine dioxygenase, alpha-ketoglutarate-dependent n=1 Tax=Thiomonas bhubaneswarensis TaxID=339866 RepID=A0A0K6HZS3_9BURK|nr:TauD/TfdA family dioxygenase [Thiomonas bhubaneswarensis]CUA96537.1 Taurine dioxygenase, alpha-ketoglutarate-dependent [Thiomonas bhubaneswarensis]
MTTTLDIAYSTLNDRQLPLVVSPVGNAPSSLEEVLTWAGSCQHELGSLLDRHGALLFRGLPVTSADDFSRFVQVFDGQVLDYIGGAVPRTRINQVVFSSTELPSFRRIRMHNELAYQKNYPDLIFFYCHQAALKGGETPIVDSRQILKELDPKVREKFVRAGVKYVRTFQEKRAWRESLKKRIPLYQHLNWADAFQSTSRVDVENRCRERGLDFQWLPNGDLSVSNVLPATIHHPRTGEASWFNQAMLQHFNARSWDLPLYLFRSVLYPDRSRLPYQAYYGDGSPISKEEIYHVIDVTYRNTVEFAWRSGDVMLVENRLVAHGRNPFQGPRKVYVAMLKQSEVAAI